MKTHLFLLSLAIGILSSTNSFAVHQMTKVVKKNTPTLMTDQFNCAGGKVDAQVVSAPNNGKISTFISRQAVNKNKLKATSVSCEGKVVDILFVRYTPNKNYVGPDSFTIQWSPNGGTRTYSFTVQ